MAYCLNILSLENVFEKSIEKAIKQMPNSRYTHEEY
jgi:hypothetical protein